MSDRSPQRLPVKLSRIRHKVSKVKFLWLCTIFLLAIVLVLRPINTPTAQAISLLTVIVFWPLFITSVFVTWAKRSRRSPGLPESPHSLIAPELDTSETGSQVQTASSEASPSASTDTFQEPDSSAEPLSSNRWESRQLAGCHYPYGIVGENYRVSEINTVTSKLDKAPDGSFYTSAALKPDPTNEEDPLAIKVLIEGIQVGWIHRYHTVFFHDSIAAALPDTYTVAARIHRSEIFLDCDPIRDALNDIENYVPKEAANEHARASLAEIEIVKEALKEDPDYYFPGRSLQDMQLELKQEMDLAFAEKQIVIAFKRLVHDFQRELKDLRDTHSSEQLQNLNQHRAGENGRCYLCGGWTDCLDNRGYVGDSWFTVKGALYPTSDHVVPQSRAHLNEVHDIHSEDNLRTAHMECNVRKGTSLISDLELPFAFPDPYDEESILANRASCDRVIAMRIACRDFFEENRLQCGDEVLNAVFWLLRDDYMESWNSRMDD